MIGNLLERRITQLLAQEDHVGSELSWIRQDPGFPDALLVDRSGQSTDSGYEIKAWYALSTELTGRFRESANFLAPRNVNAVIVAWMMSHIVYGTPTILDVLTVPALSVAEYRDRHYHNPPYYLTVEPRDTTLRTRNLQQTNVNGYRLQDTSAGALATASAVVADHPGSSSAPHSAEAQDLCTELMSRLPYRLDTNFAKVDRIDHPHIEKFKTSTLARVERGRTLKDWSRLLKALNDDKNTVAQARAAEVIEAVYEEL